MAQHILNKKVFSLLSHFPPVELAFAYGSAVFKQHGREMGKMIDLVFVVEDPESWHKDNLQTSRSHYSFLKLLGPSHITKLQKQPAGLYYNTLVHIDSQLIKYGVISLNDFYKDMMEWEWLYTSGRMHKPVLLINQATHQRKVLISEAIKFNLESAMLYSLLLLNKKEITEMELYSTITGLSYMGDFRMTLGEDKNKVQNVFLPIIEDFRLLYSPLLYKYVEYNNITETFNVKVRNC
jgi:translocator assembly and maintenance protein 41